MTGTENLSEPMLQDVRRQPHVLAELADRIDEIAAFHAEHLAHDNSARTVAFGSGDGWFAARSATSKSLLTASGLEIAGDVGPELGAGDAGIAISMSGNVDRTVEAAERLLEKGARVTALTNGGGGRLGALGLPCFALGLEDIAPFLCGTSSFLATRTVLEAFGALGRGEDKSRIAGTIRTTAETIETLLPKAEAVTAELAGASADAPAIRFLSCGARGMGIADYGAAKLVELCATPSWTDDVEEFAHRQYWTMQRREVMTMLPTSGVVAKIASESAKALKAMKVQSLWIAPDEFTGGEEAAWSLTYRDKGCHRESVAAVPLQLLAYHISRRTGFDPNKRLHLKQDEVRFTTSRQLTRRSLLGTGQ